LYYTRKILTGLRFVASPPAGGFRQNGKKVAYCHYTIPARNLIYHAGFFIPFPDKKYPNGRLSFLFRKPVLKINIILF